MRIAIVDDDPLVVSALSTIVRNSNYDVITTGTSGFDAVNLYKEHQPDLLMTDIRMREKSGLQASKEILKDFPEAKILLITTFKDDEYIHEALNIGCKGYLLKDNLTGIIPAIEAVLSGNMVFDSNIVKSMSATASHKDLSELSTRERDIIELVAEGYNNKEIAGHLYLSEGTVRNYISQMLTKLDLRDRTQLAVYYYKN
ncbi:Response regulator protein VraR [Jeotgalicoccus saudimassiliensis]|uniref:Response regulator protein VraR n=1 Tax=Jeotgalicoccus saudimassiliensis TaxID=1461582 RepID=A0A078MB99_9STAP|nr:response regulator transcription factor [Jeotgalicoccus saudimassiliensis]CEA03504.1 Response regulator protein VraR [Jeotgalicoccus saudimassiliensis]